MLVRQALAIAGEELAGKDAALAAAQGARQQAEDTFADADAELKRLTGVRDAAAAASPARGMPGYRWTA